MNSKTLMYAVVVASVWLGGVGYGLYRLGMHQGMAIGGTSN